MRSSTFVLNAILLVLLIGLAACSSSRQTNLDGNHGTPELTADINLKLASTWDSVTGLGQVQILATRVSKLHQLSLRVAYDPDEVTLLDSMRGSLVDARAVYFSTLESPEFVPVAFTYHLGEQIPATEGTIATLKFRLTDPNATPAFSIITDSEFLIARNSDAELLSIDLGGAS